VHDLLRRLELRHGDALPGWHGSDCRVGEFIGKVGNDFAGDYTLDGERLKTNDKDGKPVFDFKYTCGDTTKEMVLTLQKPDGSPDIVYGLHARAKM
jgi:hypothetical protein